LQVDEASLRGIEMGLPRFHEQPALMLSYRTIQNLDFIDRNKGNYGPFEVTQLINSFLAVLAHPWDQLLDKNELEKIKLTSKTFRECGFPVFVDTRSSNQTTSPDNACELLRRLRNGMAHGNIRLLSRKQLRQLRSSGTIPRVSENEIAAIEVCDGPQGNGAFGWCTVVDVFEMRSTLDGMMRLCEKRSLWKAEIRERQERRDLERRSKRA
jgi:hypothetical protein